MSSYSMHISHDLTFNISSYQVKIEDSRSLHLLINNYLTSSQLTSNIGNYTLCGTWRARVLNPHTSITNSSTYGFLNVSSLKNYSTFLLRSRLIKGQS